MALMGKNAVDHQKRFVELFRAELVLDRAAKHLMQQMGIDGNYLRVAQAHKIIRAKLLQVQLERDEHLAKLKASQARAI